MTYKPLEKQVILPTGDTVKLVVSGGAKATCGDVTCGDNQVCRDGSCYCAENYRTCMNGCIPKEGCCFDQECASGTCVDHACSTAVKENPKEKDTSVNTSAQAPKGNQETSSCDLLACGSNKVCLDTGDCGCKQGYSWCDFQSRCIPMGNCCDGADCRGATDCQPSGEAVNVCMDFQGEELCKRVTDDRSRFFMMGDETFSVSIIKLVDDGDGAYFRINGKIHERFRKFTSYALTSGPTMVYNQYFKYGGGCQ
ncbi:MAG: hypothetical protein GXP63_06385 [DPANN group archaeon]|nr:hypothetical protein [DPANN group archaeon]